MRLEEGVDAHTFPATAFASQGTETPFKTQDARTCALVFRVKSMGTRGPQEKHGVWRPWRYGVMESWSKGGAVDVGAHPQEA